MTVDAIPPVIHCCWFGDAPLSKLARRCIRSWQKVLPEYEIRIWTEDDYDVRAVTYVRQAYEAKKYAFVSDYARLDIIANHGGVYLDLDVEVIRPLDRFRNHTAFMGFEHGPGVNPGLILGAAPGHPAMQGLRAEYDSRSFYRTDRSPDLTTIVTTTTGYLRRRGLLLIDELQEVDGVVVYPTPYFCPQNRLTGELTVTPETHAIHHYAGSWVTRGQKMTSTIFRAIGPEATQFLVDAKRKASRRAIQ